MLIAHVAKISVLWSLGAFIALAALPTKAAGPTFNCNGGNLNAAEEAICETPRLSQLDHQLGDAYQLVFDYNSDQTTELEDIKSSERAWLRERDACGASKECIAAEYRKRIAYLNEYLPQDALANGASTIPPSVTTVFPHPGTSAGGVVRDGPGISYSRIGSLKAGDAISLLENAGQDMNGYPWFEVQTPDGTIGYQWGGVLCANNDTVSGAFGTCHALSCPCIDD